MDQTWWKHRLLQVRQADIVIVLYNGESGSGIKSEPMGIYHSELEAAMATQSAKVRGIELPPTSLPVFLPQTQTKFGVLPSPRLGHRQGKGAPLRIVNGQDLVATSDHRDGDIDFGNLFGCALGFHWLRLVIRNICGTGKSAGRS